MSLPGCPKLPLLGLTVWCATLASPVSAALIAYWNFNTLSTTGGLPSNANVTSYVPSTGTGSLTLTGWSSRAGTSAPHGISNFAGSATNAIAPDLAVQSLALQAGIASSGTPNNGAVAMLQFDLTGYADPVFSFATQGLPRDSTVIRWPTPPMARISPTSALRMCPSVLLPLRLDCNPSTFPP